MIEYNLYNLNTIWSDVSGFVVLPVEHLGHVIAFYETSAQVMGSTSALATSALVSNLLGNFRPCVLRPQVFRLRDLRPRVFRPCVLYPS